jgi:hypothetical protein
MKLWLPGQGMTDTRAARVHAAINAYDERLMFAKNEETGDWCIFVRMPRPKDPWPLYGFGDNIPSPDVALEKVQEAHLVKNKDRIWREVIDSQNAYRRELERQGDETSAETAEDIEFALRKHGKSPIVKSFAKEVSNNDS